MIELTSECYNAAAMRRETKMSLRNSGEGVVVFPAVAIRYFDKGIMLAGKSEFDSAIECFDKAIQEHPAYTLAYLNRGMVYHEVRQFKKAIKDYNKVIDDMNGYLAQAILLKERALEQLEQTRGRICTRLSNRMLVVFPPLKKAIFSILIFCWLIPLVISAMVAGMLSIFSIAVYSETINSVAALMVSFLGVTIAILIAVLTTAYVQGRGKQVSGFDIFFRALSQFKGLITEIDAKSSSTRSNQTQRGKFSAWRQLAECFAMKLDEIKPAWSGYDYDFILENDMCKYVQSSGAIMPLIVEKWDVIRVNHEMSIKAMAIGLRIMDEASVERRLVGSLFRIFLSLVALLTLAIAVRIIGGLESGQSNAVWRFTDLLIYLLMPAIAIANFGAVVHSLCLWQDDISKRDSAWK